MHYEKHEDIPQHEAELLEELFNVKSVTDLDLDQLNQFRTAHAEQFEIVLDDLETVEPEPEDDGMDGDAATALASAGFGTDEDYGLYDS